MISLTSKNSYVIAPTDLVYLFEDCKRCFHDKVKYGLQLPWSFSPHFTSADRAMRRAMTQYEVVDLGVGPRFKVVSQGEWVQSAPIAFAEYGVSLSFRGQCDAVVITDEEEVWIVDYKTTTQDDGALRKFRRQLACYTLAVEKPAKASSLPAHVDGMALLVFDPSTFEFSKDEKRGGLYGRTRWLEFPRRDDLFDTFLQGVASLLESPEAPAPGKDCGICRLRFAQPRSSTSPAQSVTILNSMI